MTYKPDIMIYHANCADGFGAAWAAWMRWGNDVEYVPCSYGDEPPHVFDKHVLIGDFSFKQPVMSEMAKDAASIIVLDHHNTAEQELERWIWDDVSGSFWAGDDPMEAVRHIDTHVGQRIAASFDKNRSGARMMWDFCHGSDAPPLIKLIEDRDLWRFAFPETKAFNLWLRAEPFDFVRWRFIDQDLNCGKERDRLFTEANAMQRFFDQKVDEIAKRVRHVRIGGHVVPSVNCPPEFVSDVAHAVLAKHKDARFAAGYWDTRDGRSWSLRSDYDGEYRLDVSEIAKRYGGGGHRNAAGFTVPLS